MPKCVLVTAAETTYFENLKDWLASIAEFPELSYLERCVLDIGLNSTQRDWLTTQNVQVIKPAWDVDLGQQKVPHYYQAMTVRPFLPRYFPSYDIIVWLDADIWVQTPSYLRQYVIGAERYGFTIAAEIDRSYSIMYGEFNPARLMHHEAYYSCFGRELADQLIQFPIINCGAFAARPDHPIWAKWQEICRQTMQRNAIKHSEQSALNLAIYTGSDTGRPHLLPALANWVCGCSCPMWDDSRKKLVEPNLPHEVLGLVHLTGVTQQIQLPITTGGHVPANLSYRGIRALAAGAPNPAYQIKVQ